MNKFAGGEGDKEQKNDKAWVWDMYQNLKNLPRFLG